MTAKLQHLKLQRFLRMEMAEQTALGQLRLLGERADGQSAQAHSTRHLNRLVEHGESGLLTLAHRHR